MKARCRVFSTSLCPEQQGQASVEAALLLPVAMLLLALLLQPVFVLYTRAVMYQAASEGARVLISAESSSEGLEESVEAYIRRRLSAVPNVAAFHMGGSSGWQIETSGDSSTKNVSVQVEGLYKPLPLVGVVASMLGEVQDSGVVIRVKIEQKSRPDWLEGSFTSWFSEWPS